jgi:hypothetical protein
MAGDDRADLLGQRAQSARPDIIDGDRFVDEDFNGAGTHSPPAGGKHAAAAVDRDRNDFAAGLDGEQKAAFFEA